ncbi:MAG: hypothetical protein LBN10_02975 [Propionibacteriaceae bacterium]|jgi:hypothetical protein|nr:hypothetical protein [Propionibacteriaceae bacterium]
MLVIGTLLKVQEQEWTDNNGQIQKWTKAALDSGQDLIEASASKDTPIQEWKKTIGKEAMFELSVNVNRGGQVKYRLSAPTQSSSPLQSSASSGPISGSSASS